LDVVERSQIPDVPGIGINGIDAPVLVAPLVPDVQNVLVVMGPDESGNAALGIFRDGSKVLSAHIANPDVEEVVYGREISNPLSIWRNLRRGLFGISKKDLEWNEIWKFVFAGQFVTP
jgi:hypothetical protein